MPDGGGGFDVSSTVSSVTVSCRLNELCLAGDAA
jgi:hypothetical protein